LDRWLEFRGFGAGCLFEFPPIGRRLSLDGLLGISGGRGLTNRAPDACVAAESEDFVERLCAGLGEVAHAFVLEVLTDDRDCPPRIIHTVAGGCPSFYGARTPTCRLTKQQRWRCRAKLKQRAAHLGIDAWWAGVPAADRTAANAPIAKNGPTGQDNRASGSGKIPIACGEVVRTKWRPRA
jgi:hypothetical protein